MSIDIGMRSVINFISQHPSILIAVFVLYVIVYLVSVLLFGKKRGRNPLLVDRRCQAEPFVHDKKLRKAVLKKKFRDNPIPNNLDAVIIGSGIGGLSAGALLSMAGKKVLVLEQHGQAGGCCHTFKEKGFEFDTGIHYIGNMTEKSVIKILLDQLTCGQLRWAKLDDDFDTVVMGKPPDAKFFHMMSGRQRYYQNLIDLFPKEKEAILKYKNLVKDGSNSFFGFLAIKVLPSFLVRILLMTGLHRIFLACYRKGYASKTLQEVLDELTDNKTLQLVMSYPFGDYGVPPKDSPFIMHAGLVSHYENGAYYPVNGSSEFAFHIVQTIQKAGGNVLMKAPVSKILFDAKGRAIGVEVGNDKVNVFAKNVISDAGIVNTFKKLLPENIAKASNIYPLVDKVGQSVSFITAFIGIEGSSKDLKLPSGQSWVFKDENINKAVDEFLSLNVDELESAEFPFLFVSFSSAKDPEWETKSPGKSSLIVITMAKWEWFEEWQDKKCNHRGECYEGIKDVIGRKLWQRCVDLYPQLDGKKVHMSVGTPVTNQHYLACPRGETYGLDHNLARFSADVGSKLRPKSDIKGLYLTGQDIMTCGFAPNVITGLLCASQILNRNIYNDLLKFSKVIQKKDSLDNAARMKKEE